MGSEHRFSSIITDPDDASSELSPWEEVDESDEDDGDKSIGESPCGKTGDVLIDKGDEADSTDDPHEAEDEAANPEDLDELDDEDEHVELMEDLENKCPNDLFKASSGMASRFSID